MFEEKQKSLKLQSLVGFQRSNLETAIDIPHIVWIHFCEELEPGQMRKMSFPVKSEISLLVIWRVTGIIQLVMSNKVL